MRTIHIVVISLGLTLILYSCLEISRVRYYCLKVKQVQLTASDLYPQWKREQSRSGDIVFTGPSPGRLYLSWTPSATLRGLVGGGCHRRCIMRDRVGRLCPWEHLRKRLSANHALQAPAAPLRS